MKPRRTVLSNQVYSLAGGNEDNDLWVQSVVSDGELQVRSVWVPDDEERAAIAAGANIELAVWGGQPPISMVVVDVLLGKGGDGG